MILPSSSEGFAVFRGWRTWYRITGDGRAVIHYDQIGCGRSTHLPEKGADFWQVPLLVEELANLLRHLNIQQGYHVLGQSWGGMLGAEHAVTRPAGLRSLVIADSPASMALWLQEANKLRALLPQDVQATLLRHEADGATDSADYQAAVRVFYDRHVCRIPWPPELQASFDALEADPTVYYTMNGPSEFHCIGTIKDWSIIDRLNRINVPTLLVSGRHDEATPEVVQPYADFIPDVRWTIFEQSSHMPHIEETKGFLNLMRDFLAEHD
jgi:L-proline amide hydrolase